MEEIKIYNYDKRTKEYTGYTIAEQDPEESRVQGRYVPLVNAFSTLIQPPEYGENEIPVYYSYTKQQISSKDKEENAKVMVENWRIEKDYRKNFYSVDKQLKVSEIKEIGEVSGYLVKKEVGEEIKNHPERYKIEGGEVVKKTAEEIAREEAEAEKARKQMLSLTAADVERAIYKAKGMDFDDIVEFVKLNPPEGLDIKALKIELKANNFYRGNPYVEQIGTLLGYTSDDLDYLFENKELPEKLVN